MKRFKYIILLMVVCFPVLAQSQVIRVSGGANLVVTGDAKLVLNDDAASAAGSFGAARTEPVVFTGHSNQDVLSQRKSFANLKNVTVSNTFGTDVTGKDNVYIFLGSELIAAKTKLPQVSMQGWPVPARDRFTVTLYSDKAAPAVLVLQDESGRILERRRVNYAVGLNTIRFDLSKYAQGTYVVRMENAPGTYLQVVKQ